MTAGKLYHIVRVLSLDVVGGVLAGSVFAARIMETRLPWYYLAVIGMTTWLVYLSDHLIDGIKKKGQTAYEVHRIFYKYRTPVILVILVVGIFDFRLALYTLPFGIIELGLITGAATLLYLLLAFIIAGDIKVLFIKELWISVIYTIALWGGPVIYSGNHAESWQIMLIISYGLLVLANVLSYSYFEYENDVADHEHTFAVDFGAGLTRYMIIGILVVSLVIWLICSVWFGHPGLAEQIILGLMTTGLFSLMVFSRVFKSSRSYGIIADALFLLPFLVLAAH